MEREQGDGAHVVSLVDPSCTLGPDVVIGSTTRVWGLTQIREGAVLGDGCVIGRNVYVGAGVRIGDRVKIQNLALIYEPAVIEDGVFVGPGVILTNDRNPRATLPDGRAASATDWLAVGVTLRQGASIGAGAVCVAPLNVGRWAMVGAGATVVDDVPDHALVVGSPARQIGWVGRAGHRLEPLGDHRWRCPVTGATFVELDGALHEEPADD